MTGEIKIWDSENLKKELQTIKIEPRETLLAGQKFFLNATVVRLAWRKDKKMIAAGLRDGTIRVFDKIK